MNRVNLHTLILQEHPDHVPMFLFNGYSDATTIEPAHQLAQPAIQRFWCLLQAPSLPLSGVGPLQDPNMLLVSPIKSLPGCITLIPPRLSLFLHLAVAP